MIKNQETAKKRGERVYKNETAYSKGTGSAKVIEVIETISKIGSGTEIDPNRFVTKYWSLDGKLLAINDPEN